MSTVVDSVQNIGEFDEVVRLHWQRIFRFVQACVRDESLAEDLTQDCFWRAYRGWKWFRGDSSVYTWLRRIAANVIKNSLRSERVQFRQWGTTLLDPDSIEAWLPDSTPSPETAMVKQERVQHIWEALRLVSPRQRKVFHLRFAEDLDVPEIAAAMGISEGSVKVHLFRGVQTVRKSVKGSRKT